jgi:uncharacterized protein YcaQ
LRRPAAPSPEPTPRAKKHGATPRPRAEQHRAKQHRATPNLPIELSRAEARAYLLTQLGLDRRTKASAANVRALLSQLRCIQLDPLDPMGTNADLVAMARLQGLPRGAIYTHVYENGAAFEHFAKERCLLPGAAFPFYRERMVQTPWWRVSERMKRVPPALVDAVESEVRERGPISAKALTDRGRVEAIDWGGWKGTSKATSMALEILWTQCRVVVCGRSREGKLYDVPERALGPHGSHAVTPNARDAGAATHDSRDAAHDSRDAAHDSRAATHDSRDAAPGDRFARWALVERVEAAGLLARTSGPTWSMLSDARTSALPDALVDEGTLDAVRLEGSKRAFLAPANVRDRATREPDDALRILGPLDPLLWDRALLRELFDFDYVWEVYKPEAERRFAWYVMPLLHHGALVGRLSGRVDGTTLVIEALWREDAAPLDDAALDAALQAHAEACRCDAVKRPRRARRNP